MKKIYILMVLSFLFQQNKAQHTLTAAFNPAIGDIDSQTTLDTAGLFLGSSGTSQVWNYTGISTGTNAPYGYTYVPMSSVPNSSLYTTGTIAADVGIGGIYYVYSNTSSKVEWLGATQPTPSNCGIYSDPQIIYSLPFMYGSSITDTFNQTNPTTRTGTTTASGDGTGTLQLPSGTYPNILKLTTTFYETGGPNTITSVENQYYSALSKFPLLTVGTLTSSIYGIMKYGTINTPFTLGVLSSVDINNPNVFPNPITNGELFLTDQKNEILSVSFNNVLGQTVKTVYFGNKTTDNKKVDVSELAKGVYYLRIDSNQGLRTKKIIVE